MTYDTIRPTIKTFDVFLFSGKGFFSSAIRFGQWLFTGKYSPYSHVGIAIVSGGRVMIYESTTLNGKKGVQLNPASERIKNYKGTVSIRQMQCHRGITKQSKAEEFVALTLGLPYEKSVAELIGAAIETKIDAKASGKIDTDYFCSEAVCGLLRYCGLFDSDKADSEFDPAAFAEGGRVEKYLVKAKLLKEIPIMA